jgi:heptosyltransferase III
MPTRHEPAADDAVRRIAVLRPNHRIGNTLLLTPLMQELESRFPGAGIEFVTAGGAARPVFARYPGVTALHCFPGKSYRHPLTVLQLLLRLRGPEYDLAIDPTTRSRAGRFLLRFVRARRRIGFAWGQTGADRILTDAVDPAPAPAHHAEIPLYLLRTALRPPGASAAEGREQALPLDLRLTGEERQEGARQLAAALGNGEPGLRPVVGLYAHATGDKCLPPAWWLRLAGTLQAQAPWLQLIEFLPEDGYSRLGDVVRGTYTPELRMLAAKLAATSLFVIADGGILHLADAAGARVLGLFRTTSPEQYAPRRPGSQALTGIDAAPEAVAARIVELLTARAGSPVS